MNRFLLIGGAFFIASVCHADLLVNGNFENFNSSGTNFMGSGSGYWTFGAGSTALPGWNIAPRVGDVSIDVVNGTYSHADFFGVDLAGTSGPGSITQSVSVSDSLFALSFWAQATGSSENFSLLIDFGSFSTVQALDGVWHQYTILIAPGTSGSTLLSLATTPTNNTNGNLFIDNVSLQAVPEPFTMGLGGAAVLLALRRMKKRATA